MKAYEPGDKIEYKVSNKKGDDQWLKGVVHGVKKAQDTNDNDLVLGYLVDTGKDERVDEYRYDPRAVEITKRANANVGKNKTFLDAVAEVEKDKNLPKSEIKVEKVRQPKQVEVLPDNIRLAE